jgi:eukaryotic-like serine/threonine-protein kinase
MNGSTVILVAFLTAAVTSGGSVYVIERYGILPSRAPVAETTVPDLHGVSEADARANTAALHIALLIAAREPSLESKPGAVIRQSIAAGQRIPRDSSMSVVLAEEVPRVPSVAGLAVTEATQRLELRGFSLELGPTAPHPTVAEGLIVDQSPAAETALPKGSRVTVHVSSGTGEVEIPKLMGVGLTKAKADLEKLGIKPVIRWVAMAETPTYVVLGQKPAAGEKVKAGAEVQLTVCR